MDIKKLHKEYENCECGKTHNCPIDYVVIGEDIAKDLEKICSEFNNALLVSDENTYKVCGENVYGILKNKISSNLILKPNGDIVIPNEEKIEEIEKSLSEETDIIIGIGSGVINDLCKYVSFKNGLPYIIVATAPSMDGYASVGAALILGGMKVTLNARPPKAILADTNVLKNAPMDMIRAGYGDIIGKYSCLNDWKLSKIINDEYYCQKISDLTYSQAEKVRKLAGGLVNRDEEAVKVLMEALVLVGIAMSFVDCSRPASGSEHHLSHFFEITGILEGKEYYPHGIDVGFSSVVTAKIRDKVSGSSPLKREFDREKWEKEIKRIYLSSAEGVIELQNKLNWYAKDDSSVINEKWYEIKEALKETPSEEEFKNMLSDVGLNFSDFEKMYGEEKIKDAVLYAKDLKDRYSVLWLNYEYFA